MPLLFDRNVNLWFLEGWRNLQQLYISSFTRHFRCNKKSPQRTFLPPQTPPVWALSTSKRERDRKHDALPSAMWCRSRKDPFLIYVCMLQWANLFLLLFRWKLLFLINARTMAHNSWRSVVTEEGRNA